MASERAGDVAPDYCTKPVVVLGCGNVLFGDDGFGPAVAERLGRSGALPAWATVIDAGTAVREILFDMVLSERRPVVVVVVDAMDAGREPGEVFEVPLERIPAVKVSEFSPHQAPTSNLLRELEDSCGVEVVVVACQAGSPSREMRMGLSPEMEGAADRAARVIEDRFFREPVARQKRE